MKSLVFVGAVFISMVAVAQETPPASTATPPPATTQVPPAAPAGSPTPTPAVPVAPTTAAPSPTPAPAPQAAPAPTDPKLGKITQIFRDRKRVIMTVEPGVADAEIPFVVNIATSPGELCEGQVMQTHSGKSLIEFSTCKAFDQIKVGADVHASLFQGPPTDQAALRTTNVPSAAGAPASPQGTAAAADEPEERTRPAFTMSLGYHSGSAWRFDNVTYSSGSGSGDGTMEYDVDPAMQLSLGAIYSRPRSWGGYVGLTIEEARRVKSSKATLDGGGTVTGLFLDPPKLTLLIAEANGMYRFNEFYLLFGLNYAIPKLDYSPASGTSISLKGAVGAQLGVGLMLEEHYRLELVSMFMSLQMEETTPTAHADYRYGYLSGALLRFGYCF